MHRWLGQLQKQTLCRMGCRKIVVVVGDLWNHCTRWWYVEVVHCRMTKHHKVVQKGLIWRCLNSMFVHHRFQHHKHIFFIISVRQPVAEKITRLEWPWAHGGEGVVISNLMQMLMLALECWMLMHLNGWEWLVQCKGMSEAIVLQYKGCSFGVEHTWVLSDEDLWNFVDMFCLLIIQEVDNFQTFQSVNAARVIVSEGRYFTRSWWDRDGGAVVLHRLVGFKGEKPCHCCLHWNHWVTEWCFSRQKAVGYC